MLFFAHFSSPSAVAARWLPVAGRAETRRNKPFDASQRPSPTVAKVLSTRRKNPPVPSRFDRVPSPKPTRRFARRHSPSQRALETRRKTAETSRNSRQPTSQKQKDEKFFACEIRFDTIRRYATKTKALHNEKEHCHRLHRTAFRWPCRLLCPPNLPGLPRLDSREHNGRDTLTDRHHTWQRPPQGVAAALAGAPSPLPRVKSQE